MDKQTFPTLDQERWTTSPLDVDARVGAVLDISNPVASPGFANDAVESTRTSAPISSAMQENVPTVDAEDFIDQVERVLGTNNLTAVPVLGSNGAIVGVIGAHEITQFVAEKKNAKAVRAWEISRCRLFEVGPNDPVDEVAKLLAENQFDYIAVTELGSFKGMVQARDLVPILLAEKEAADNASRGQTNSTGMSRRHDD
ncbi:hypothetical protein BH11PSE11_BH11PSE11_07990 [soil metagenome]